MSAMKIFSAPSCVDPFEEDLLSLDDSLRMIEKRIKPDPALLQDQSVNLKKMLRP